MIKAIAIRENCETVFIIIFADILGRIVKESRIENGVIGPP